MTLKLRAKVNFPASVTGKKGLKVSKSNGVWTVEPDFSSLVAIDPVTNSDELQIWVYTPSTDTYNVTTISALIDLVGNRAEPTLVTGDGAVSATDAVIAVQRTSPTKTSLSLPAISTRDGLPLRVVDWSTSVTDHEIELTPDGSETIMQAATWSIFSNSAQLGSLMLYPSTTLNGWYIAP